MSSLINPRSCMRPLVSRSFPCQEKVTQLQFQFESIWAFLGFFFVFFSICSPFTRHTIFCCLGTKSPWASPLVCQGVFLCHFRWDQILDGASRLWRRSVVGKQSFAEEPPLVAVSILNLLITSFCFACDTVCIICEMVCLCPGFDLWHHSWYIRKHRLAKKWTCLQDAFWPICVAKSATLQL